MSDMFKPEDVTRMMAKLKLSAAWRKSRHRLDRWCHNGVVEYRLPFLYRLDCANGRY